MLPTKAWPYAVTRGQTSGYQAIVVPGFLGDTGQAYVLEYASRQETDEPGIVTVRDVVGATREPLSVAYRVREVRADRYGLGGDGLLEDGSGRAIRVFEGLVLPIPAERVPAIGLTAADLDRVTGVTVPAFRKLWAAGTRVDAEPSTPISVGGASGAPPLNLQLDEPYVVPGASPPRPPRTRLIGAVAIVCVLAAVAGWYLARSTSPSSTPARTVSQLCDSDGQHLGQPGDPGSAARQRQHQARPPGLAGASRSMARRENDGHPLAGSDGRPASSGGSSSGGKSW